jgi:hypothetical protein
MPSVRSHQASHLLRDAQQLLGSLLLAGAGRWIVSFLVFLVLLEFKRDGSYASES